LATPPADDTEAGSGLELHLAGTQPPLLGRVRLGASMRFGIFQLAAFFLFLNKSHLALRRLDALLLAA
jgi:hypothetical protein